MSSASSLGQRIEHQDNELDTILLQGMKDLSFDELQREQEEMHGVCNDFDEETQVMDDLIKSLKEHLSKVKRGTAYEAAEIINPSYASSRDILIIFLRANRYEPKAASKQMIKYFDLKQELFGNKCLGRDITSNDLTEEDMRVLMEGSLQVADCTDQAGRMIAIGFAGLRSFKVLKSELRVRFFQCQYIIMEASSRGCIIVSYSIGQYQDKRAGEGFIEAMKLTLAMPCNIAGFHLVTDDKSQCTVASMALSMFASKTKAKTKVHFGSHQESQYLLSSFGIPRKAIPLKLNNDMDLTNHKRWFQKCKQKEELRAKQVLNQQLPVPSTTGIAHLGAPNTTTNPSSSFLEERTIPTDSDVLFMRRKVNGVGNERLMAMAIRNAESYDMSSNKGRKVIMNSMIEEIAQQGGRFLKPSKSADSGGKIWLEVPEKEIYEKIGQM